MARADDRAKYRKWHKELKKMSINEFERFLISLVAGQVNKSQEAVEEVLRKEFGFGDKRLEKLGRMAQEIYDKKD